MILKISQQLAKLRAKHRPIYTQLHWPMAGFLHRILYMRGNTCDFGEYLAISQETMQYVNKVTAER